MSSSRDDIRLAAALADRYRIERQLGMGGKWLNSMYVAKLGEVIYVLCAFQKKATRGISMPKHLLDRVAERLRQVRAIHQQRGAEP